MGNLLKAMSLLKACYEQAFPFDQELQAYCRTASDNAWGFVDKPRICR
uniref:Uncharacterized protein n=1 Tax=Coprothermobacter proteolyticus (strain ATCC 35245 / DSM 5265 / OCM 4 / BT) TaxID=309798 RepID=B5Y939_COPPD